MKTHVLEYFNGVSWDPQYGFGPFMNESEAVEAFRKGGYAERPSRYRVTAYCPCVESGKPKNVGVY